METLTRTDLIMLAKDLRAGDVLNQEIQTSKDGEPEWTTRRIRLDRIGSGYTVYTRDGQNYLVPVLLLDGWDVQRGRAVKIVCSGSQAWDITRTR